MKFSSIEEKVLGRIKPDAIPDVVYEVLEKLSHLNVQLGGSTAKGTFLVDDHDIDVFVKFEDDEGISDGLESELKLIFPDVKRVAGSRDYFQLIYKGFNFEFVPVLNIAGAADARNVTDVSPLHVAYVKERVDDELRDHIRLTKQFMKSAKVYGAESYIGGFSGHIVDLLIIHYGSFHSLLREAANWQPPIAIDIEGHHKEPMEELNASKLQSPLVVVDPIQPQRNAAAALTREKYEDFIVRAKAYLANPSEEFFKVIPLTKEEFSEEHPDSRIISIELLPLMGKRDVIGAKCQKVYQYLQREVEKNDFTIFDSEWEFQGDKALLLFAVKDEILLEKREMVGPPLDMEDAIEAFKAQHSEVIERDGRAIAIEDREYRDIDGLLEHLLNTSYLGDRVSGYRIDS